MHLSSKSTDVLARVALFAAAIIWGSSFFVVKNAVDVMPPNFLLGIRFTIGCVLLAIVFHKRLAKLNKDYFIKGGIIGFCLFAAYSIQTIGITDTTPGKNAFLTAIYCVIVPFLYWLVDKNRPGIYNFIAAIICIIGIGLVSLTDGFSIGFGDSLTLISGFMYAAHIIAVSKLAGDKDPIVITILQFGYAAIFSWVVTLLFETPPALSVFNGSTIGAVLFLGICATGVALLCQNIGQKYTDPSAASIILCLESVFGVLFSVIFYGEQLTLRLFIGFVLIFIAILISETKLSFLKQKRQL